mmetsp:Transcript_509/g.836  ORF Transcript_509/g.836 Transcript_509/m.836 type:complete len:487 (+) Transcript_509:96-1556(+)|eukprot:CAMPEP_0197516420 /NCGR_PEP_ID=MMETSP1318-20131121/1306_1 /TAXON_ID=552666 /ORGANISM="Partenskyella glossopodia, Strain RCC365" /LENGTH=486 /DNA_ID=CAMNT_0043065153 /DNA_START=22 /DNA_END=1482 /DNA_ORIENTATION=+
MTQGSYVDETLFGSSRKPSRSGYAVISKSKINGLLGDSVTIKRSELNALKNKAVLKTVDRRSIAKEKRQKALAERSRIRKERMAKKGAMGNTVLDDKLNMFKKQGAVSKSELQAMKDKNHDDVQHMNQIMLYAECAMVREKQIAEKKKIKLKEKEVEKQLHLEMEKSRIKAIRELEVRETIKLRKKKEDAVIIRKQIAERERERLRKRELAEQEGQRIVQRIKENEKRQEEEAQAKIEYIRKLHEEILAANDAAARAKLRKKQQEIEEDERIAKYIREKEAREAAEEERQNQIAAAKEMEVSRLRSMQEKANDQRSELDELRARRYQEAHDRKWRLAEREKALKHQEMLRDLARVRSEQKMYKEKRVHEIKKQDYEAHMAALLWQKKEQEKEDREAEKKRMARVDIQKIVLSQIQEKEASKVKKRVEYRKERGKVMAKLDEEKDRIEAIKMAKLEMMARKGVPEKFRAELAKKQVLKPKIGYRNRH